MCQPVSLTPSTKIAIDETYETSLVFVGGMFPNLQKSSFLAPHECEPNHKGVDGHYTRKEATFLLAYFVTMVYESCSQFNPIDNLKGLLENNAPMFVVHGDSDVSVPYEVKTQLRKERYKLDGGQIDVKVIAGEGHKATPSFFECRKLLTNFVSIVGRVLIVLSLDAPSMAQPQSRSLAANIKPPNIVLILTDDLGWHDLGCYGNEWHETPHLDRLATEGMRFTNAYASAPICSASRAAILTGKSPGRLGFEFVTKNPNDKPPFGHALQSPPYTVNLPLEEVSLAEMLAAAEYQTGYFGKWHLSQHEGGYLGWSLTHGPFNQGFQIGDSDFGCHTYGYLKRDGRKLGKYKDGEFPLDTLTDKAIDFVKQNRDQPFFFQLSHYFVHDPIHSKVGWLVEKYRRKLPDDVPGERASYGAMVETLDHLVGRLLQAIDDLDLSENTIVVFTSDNGGHPNFSANGPLRGSKWNLYEGGIRIPWIVRWPGVVSPSTINAEPVIHCDLFPTFRDLAGIADDKLERDGRSLVSSLRGDTTPSDTRPFVWHFPYYHPETDFEEAPATIGIDDFATSQTRPHSAIRLGSHKLLHFYEDNRNELYDLSNDASEQHDLATKEPDRTQALEQQLMDYLKEVHARFPSVKSQLKQ
jgi:arylsulfatase A